MADRLHFEAAAERLTLARERHTDLCEPFLDILPVDGAAISTLMAPFVRETLCANNSTAARLDEIQLDLGEGPVWDACATRNPVLVSDIRRQDTVNPFGPWPALGSALIHLDVGAVYAFPLLVGSLSIGAVTLYAEEPGELGPDDIVDALLLANIVSRQVLRNALSEQRVEAEPDGDEGFSRRIVHQATGMVLAQIDSSASDALLLIHGQAFSSGRTVRQVAKDVVSRDLDFALLNEP
ncbi:MAG: GAF and ANTAR domain-containing protein [Cryobacterium sp.]